MKRDLRWLFIGVILIVALIVAIIINHDSEKTTSTRIADTIDIDNGDLKIDWNRYRTIDVKLENTYTISESGTYHFTGMLDGGNIVVDAGLGDVRLILDNVSIYSDNGPAIICNAAEDLVIELVGENVIEDSEEYSSAYDEDVTGAIYSKADLTFQGDGSLNLSGNYLDAIVGKDDVKFNGGTYNIVSNDDAIRGKDSVYIVDGNFTITAATDGIKVTNEYDAGKGFVLIENGNFDLIAEDAKGIKATKYILIYGGNLSIDSFDDAIHSNSYLNITGGFVNISSGDDGIHADKELIIDGGEIYVVKAYEGLEAQVVTINEGKVSLTTNDDGINAGGGADNSAKDRPGANPFDADEDCVLSINGGDVYVNSAGDGIDSNGWLYFNGGSVIVDGPINDGNGSLDAGMGILINGGEVFTVGSSGMAESLGNNSNVNNISVYFESEQAANTKIEIRDRNGDLILEHVSAKKFSHLAAGSSKFQFGETYTIYLNGEEYTDFTIDNVTTLVGNNNMNFMHRR